MTDKKIIINIGRQFGSGGKAVAEVLGKKLNIPVYDNELVAEAAVKSGFSPELFRKSDERRSLLSLGGLLGNNNSINDSELFKIQSETIREIATGGSAIFIGRAANYILRDMDCLDVFISAPVENRIKRISERLSVSAEEAEALIRKRDKGRAEYYNFFTFGHWGKASDYDLCIDSSRLGIEKTADYIISFLEAQASDASIA